MNNIIEAVVVAPAVTNAVDCSTGTNSALPFLSVPFYPILETTNASLPSERDVIASTVEDIQVEDKESLGLQVEIYSVREPDQMGNTSLSLIIELIRGDVLAQQVEKIRQAAKDKNKKKADWLKTHLPALRPALYLSDGKEIATGVIQFDIDKDKNDDDLDFNKLKDEIKLIPQCIYAFESPTQGLKFGIKTDFAGITECKDDIKLSTRFRSAYWKTKRHVQDCLSRSVVFDDVTKSIWRACFFSHDPDAYFNQSCEELKINSECEYVQQEYLPVITDTHDISYVTEILSHIPSGFDYHQRLPINFAVLNALGENGIPLLLSHWQFNPKLHEQLEDQFDGCKYGWVGHLINVAEANGYEQPKNRARRNLRPIPTDIKLEPLKSAHEAKDELVSYVRQFFKDGINTFINITAGSGKTTNVIEVLANEIQNDVKVLFLVPNHELANQIAEKFDQIRRKSTSSLSERSEITHLRGQSTLCDVVNGKSILNKPEVIEGQTIPWKYCSEKCPLNRNCGYINQFNHSANIRLMTHHEWFQKSSAWFHGVRYESGKSVCYPSDDLWIPDYIIVDEDIIDLVDAKQVHVEDGSRFQSIKAIVQEIEHGKSLVSAIDMHVSEILVEGIDNEKPEFPKFTGSVKGYQIAVLAWRKEMKSHSFIMERLVSFVETRDERHLFGMWFDDRKLKLCELRIAASEYEDVPTLFLDATANARLVSRVLPNTRFHSIKLKSKEDIHTYQLANMNVKQADVNKDTFRVDLEHRLRNLIQQNGYQNVGLITYKNAEGVDGNFDAYLASRLGITSFEHFGNLRGSNSFEDVDCLLVVGRSFITHQATELLSSAIFGESSKFQFVYANAKVRMKDGTCCLLNGATTSNGYHQAVHEHFSLAETKQAIGRARTIFGDKKDVYLFSNESLGTDIEITDFFYWDDYKGEKLVSAEVLEELTEKGFLKNKPEALEQLLGLSQPTIRKKREQLTQEFLDAGFSLATCRYRDNASRKKKWQGFVADQSKLEFYLIGQGMKELQVTYDEDTADDSDDS